METLKESVGLAEKDIVDEESMGLVLKDLFVLIPSCKDSSDGRLH